MNPSNTPIDPRGDYRFQELADLFAKGYLRLSKTPEWREQAAKMASSRADSACLKRTPTQAGKSSEKHDELTG